MSCYRELFIAECTDRLAVLDRNANVLFDEYVFMKFLHPNFLGSYPANLAQKVAISLNVLANL